MYRHFHDLQEWISPLQQRFDYYSSIERQIRESVERLGGMDAIQKWVDDEKHRRAELFEMPLQRYLESLQPPTIDSPYLAISRELQAPKEQLLQRSALTEVAEFVNRQGVEAWSQLQRTVEALPKLPDAKSILQHFGLTELDDQMRALRERWDRDLRAASPTFESVLGSISNAAEVLRASHITVRDDTLTVNGFDINHQELEQFLAGEDGLEVDSLEALSQAIAQQKDPRKRARYLAALLFLLQSVLLQFVISFAASKAERAWSERPSQQKMITRVVRNDTEQRASRAVEQGVPPQLLARYRIVTAGTLVVRAKPKKDSRRLGQLHVGDVVFYLRTAKRSWALVEWAPGGEEVRVRGWVFARYLEKLRLPSSVSTEAADEPED